MLSCISAASARAACTSSHYSCPEGTHAVASASDASVAALLLDRRLLRMSGHRLGSFIAGMVVSFMTDCCNWKDCPTVFARDNPSCSFWDAGDDDADYDDDSE